MSIKKAGEKMKLYHYTERQNVLNMYHEGIRPNSFWCESIDDCYEFIGRFAINGIIKLPYDYAVVSMEFKDSEIEEFHDKWTDLFGRKTYICHKKISYKKMPKLLDVPAYTLDKRFLNVYHEATRKWVHQLYIDLHSI